MKPLPLQGLKRRIIYVTAYELIAVLVTGVALLLFSSSPATRAGLTAVLSSAIAAAWNFIYNAAFERWEARRSTGGRPVRLRVVHALGFELGLTFMLVPLFALMLGISLWAALLFDLGAILFFLVYTYVFNLVFDHLFGLPLSAQRRGAHRA